jgi:hypothetical protein
MRIFVRDVKHDCEVLEPAWINVFTSKNDFDEVTHGVLVKLPIVRWRRRVDMWTFKHEYGWCIPVFGVSYRNGKLQGFMNWERHG